MSLLKKLIISFTKKKCVLENQKVKICLLWFKESEVYKQRAKGCFNQKTPWRKNIAEIFIFISTGWYWTGGTDVLTEGEWVWPMTGTPLTLFDDWKEGEPNGHNGGEDCLEYGTQTTKKWNDNKCNATLKFICEKNAVY